MARLNPKASDALTVRNAKARAPSRQRQARVKQEKAKIDKKADAVLTRE